MEINPSPTEQTTAVTDGLLFLLCLACVLYLRRIGRRDPWKTSLWCWTFGLVGLGSALGAVVHGFKHSSVVRELLWQPIHLSLGLAVALFLVGAIYDLRGARAARRSLPAMAAVAVAIYGITRIVPGTFLMILYEGAVMLLSLAAYSGLAWRGRLKGAGLMAAGVFITILASVVQATRSLSFTLLWPFDHNGIFHWVQMVGVLVLAAGLRAALQGEDFARSVPARRQAA
jgi:uncharacterized protein DUF6962